jgi:hypothetical protein
MIDLLLIMMREEMTIVAEPYQIRSLVILPISIDMVNREYADIGLRTSSAFLRGGFSLHNVPI